jgi:hypothetical protein
VEDIPQVYTKALRMQRRTVYVYSPLELNFKPFLQANVDRVEKRTAEYLCKTGAKSFAKINSGGERFQG